MTTQLSHRFTNEHPHPALKDLHIYGIKLDSIMSTDARRDYFIKRQPHPAKLVVCTACWSGYVCNYRLRANGKLWLESYEYPFAKDADSDIVNEQVRGNFWLLARDNFFGRDVNITFRNSVLVEDEEVWVIRE